MDQELITLTPEQLTEVCVRLAILMGWTTAPGSLEWVLAVKRTGAKFKEALNRLEATDLD